MLLIRDTLQIKKYKQVESKRIERDMSWRVTKQNWSGYAKIRQNRL